VLELRLQDLESLELAQDEAFLLAVEEYLRRTHRVH